MKSPVIKPVKNVKLSNVKTGEKSIMELAGIFVLPGLKPNTGFLQGGLPLDDTSHIVTNDRMETEFPEYMPPAMSAVTRVCRQFAPPVRALPLQFMPGDI